MTFSIHGDPHKIIIHMKVGLEIAYFAGITSLAS